MLQPANIKAEPDEPLPDRKHESELASRKLEGLILDQGNLEISRVGVETAQKQVEKFASEIKKAEDTKKQAEKKKASKEKTLPDLMADLVVAQTALDATKEEIAKADSDVKVLIEKEENLKSNEKDATKQHKKKSEEHEKKSELFEQKKENFKSVCEKLNVDLEKFKCTIDGIETFNVKDPKLMEAIKKAGNSNPSGTVFNVDDVDVDVTHTAATVTLKGIQEDHFELETGLHKENNLPADSVLGFSKFYPKDKVKEKTETLSKEQEECLEAHWASVWNGPTEISAPWKFHFGDDKDDAFTVLKATYPENKWDRVVYIQKVAMALGMQFDTKDTGRMPLRIVGTKKDVRGKGKGGKIVIPENCSFSNYPVISLDGSDSDSDSTSEGSFADMIE